MRKPILSLTGYAVRGAATTVFLEHTVTRVAVARSENEPAAFNLEEGKARAYAQNRTMLLALAECRPGARVKEALNRTLKLT